MDGVLSPIDSFVADCSPVACLVLKNDVMNDEVIKYNKAAQGISQYPEKQVLNKRWQSVAIPPLHVQEYLKTLKSQKETNLSTQWKNFSGEIVPVDLSFHFREDIAVIFIRDMTEERQTNSIKDEAQPQLMFNESQLLAMMSHEMRTPLNGNTKTQQCNLNNNRNAWDG